MALFQFNQYQPLPWFQLFHASDNVLLSEVINLHVFRTCAQSQASC